MGPAGQANDEAHTSDETNISGLRFPATWASHCGAGRTLDFFGPGWVHGEPEVGSPLSDRKPGEQAGMHKPKPLRKESRGRSSEF